MNDTNLIACTICPRRCSVNRAAGELGYCSAAALPRIALVSCHYWEEPPISGTQGSGTVFFSHCNMGCLFCQNHTISHEGFGKEISIERLAQIFLEQQQKNVHNINLVSPTHYLPQIAQALRLAKADGLVLPVVYNSNGYETVEGLRLLEGLVDIYLPDFKYWDDTLAMAYSATPQYQHAARQSILEMRRQVGTDIFDENGIMQKGLIIRHLVLPSHYKDSLLILDWIYAALGKETYVSLLNQYTPMYRATEVKALSRRLTTYEYEKVRDYFLKLGMKNGFMQQRNAATAEYTPIFDLQGVEESVYNKNTSQ